MNKDKNLKVSVITVVYNSAKTLEQTILSVINQTYTNIEYIIIDGGSTDGSIAIIKKYSKNIYKWLSEKDKGISDAFNKGINLATGDIIGILNADDWYEDDAVQKIIENMEHGYAVYCANINLVKEDGNIRQLKSRVHKLNLGMYIMHPTVFVKSEVYKQVGLYSINRKIAMDYDMFLRIRKNNFKIKYINYVIANMRVGGASSDTTTMHKEELEVKNEHLTTGNYVVSLLYNYLHRMILKGKNLKFKFLK